MDCLDSNFVYAFFIVGPDVLILRRISDVLNRDVAPLATHSIGTSNFWAGRQVGRHGPLSEQQIAELASIQSAIAAFEAVLDDLDAEAEEPLRAA